MTPGPSARLPRLLPLLIALTPLAGCTEEEGPKLVFYDTSGGVDKILIQHAQAAKENGWAPRSDGRLDLEPIPEELAQSFFGGLDIPGSRKVYDPDCYYFGLANMRGHQKLSEHHAGGFPVVTNNLGLREDTDTEGGDLGDGDGEGNGRGGGLGGQWVTEPVPVCEVRALQLHLVSCRRVWSLLGERI